MAGTDEEPEVQRALVTLLDNLAFAAKMMLSFSVKICLDSGFCRWKMSSRRASILSFVPCDQNLRCKPGNDE